ncbi:MAG TPA: glycosyltransferase family 39 protein [Myxococcales bacterium]|nr:glycosyltransferase family 39 protein [Myxococcales bacterium]
MIRTTPRVPAAVYGLGAVASAFTLTKAVHVDDAAHLFIAQAILRDPAHASSAMVNWDQVPEPIHALNVPHLLMYAFAGALKLGAPVQALHLISAAFVILSLCLIWRFTALLAPQHALWVTALVAVGPAFLPAANLMMDVPTLAIWAGFFSCMALYERERREARAWQACAFAAAGCLIKYSSIALLPAFVFLVAWRRSWRSLLALALPLSALLAWSGFNWFAYGGVHLFERAAELGEAGDGLSTLLALSAGRLPLWAVGLGALSPFALAFAGRGRGRLLVVCALLGAAVAVAGLSLPLSDLPAFEGVNSTDAVLRGLFFANGLFFALLARRAIRQGGEGTSVLAAWVLSALALAVFVAPFPAARHVLLAMPALLVLVTRAFPPAPAGARAALAATAALGVALAVSDWRRAEVYREEAQAIPSRARTWTVGHWGWQWYAAQRGLREYAPGQSRLAPGDLVVAPQGIHRQRFSAEDAAILRPVASKAVRATALDFLRTVTPAGGLYYYWAAVPWTVRSGPVETFQFYEVEKPLPAPGLARAAFVPAAARE